MMATIQTDKLQTIIEKAFEDIKSVELSDLKNVLKEFITLLDTGQIRSASPGKDGWQVNTWVKKGILLLFRTGEIGDFSINEQFQYFDKTNIPPKRFSLDQKVRIVPGGTSVRSGCYVAQNVVLMPPAYINIGAYVDEGSMIDSHALVGSCAQIGKNIHLSAAAQIGGVLEPIGGLPVIIEDNVVVGGNCGVFEGTIVEKNCVLGSGVILNRSTPVYDCVKEKIYRASTGNPLRIPSGAVVIPGARPLSAAFAKENHLFAQAPIIIKYRDAATDAATAMEEALR